MGNRKKPKNLNDLELSLKNKIIVPWYIIEKTLKEYNINLNNLERVIEHCDYLVSEIEKALLIRGILTIKDRYGQDKLELKSEIFRFRLVEENNKYKIIGAVVRNDSDFEMPKKEMIRYLVL